MLKAEIYLLLSYTIPFKIASAFVKFNAFFQKKRKTQGRKESCPEKFYQLRKVTPNSFSRPVSTF